MYPEVPVIGINVSRCSPSPIAPYVEIVPSLGLPVMCVISGRKFVEEATWECFDASTKPKLVDLANYCEIQEVKASMKKQQIKNLLIDYFVDEVFEEKYLDKKKEVHSSDDETSLKIKQLDLEILKLESEAKIESQKIQAKERVQLKKLALEKAKLNASSGSSHSDPTHHVRLVPPFQEKEVDKYFSNFEKVNKKT